MNVLIISQNIVLGGAQRVLVHLSDYLNRNGHNSWILTPHLDLEHMPEVARRQRYIECPFPILRKVGYEYKMRSNIGALAYNILRMRRFVKDIVRKYEIDLISAHNPPSNWIASFSKVPVVWSCNEPVSLCSSRRKPDYFPLSIAPPTFLDRFMEAIYEMIDFSVCHWGIDHFVVLSRYTQNAVKNIYNREAKICRVGADFDSLQKGKGQSVRKRYNLENSFLLLQVGHFKPEKNQEISVRAINLLIDKIPGIRLVFVGEGALADEIKRLAERLGVKENVVFAGRVSDEQLPDYYDACDFALFPAERQSWGLVVLEALAAGKLSVVSSDCGVSEVLIEKNIGFICDPTPEALAQRLLEVYHARQSLDGMVERGQRYTREELSYEAYGNRMMRLFQDILDRKTTCLSA